MREQTKSITIKLMLFIYSLCFFNLTLFSQKKGNLSANITGSVMVSTDGTSFFYNMGGPGVKWTKDKWMIGLNLIPSLRFFKDEPRPFVTPMLGAGVIIGYKRWMLGVPMYYLSAKAEWIATVGVGVKLGK
jgi:hypothetical protein